MLLDSLYISHNVPAINLALDKHVVNSWEGEICLQWLNV
jgi:hypothetical protein